MLPQGTRIGPYEITGPLGAGGMGEVYRARDPRLGRDVAIKALSADVAQSPERRTRFEREAQLLASLKHPNIATLHGLEEADDAKYLVLELVEGRTLSEVIRDAGGALPVNEAVAIATQIAEGLMAAHEKGIIHRDLKPGNVMVGPDGHVKVLDFGLGKSLDVDSSRAGDPSAAAHSPTMTLAATQAGLILGTAGYMSPEQAKGRPADRRSDVWGFGCLLYEMLSGKRAFDGEDVTEILAHVVRGEPDWSALPAGVPPALRQLTERCLIKDRTQRISDVSVIRFLLQERASAPVPLPAEASPKPAKRAIGWPLGAGLVAAAAILGAGVARIWSSAPPPPAAALTRLSIPLPDEQEIAQSNMGPIAISPDGRLVAYTGRRPNGVAQLFLRELDKGDPVLLPGTDVARCPFFSPDGKWIGFFAKGKLKKITVTGAALQEVADAPDGRGGSWAKDDTIYFAPTNIAGIMKVAAGGGAPAWLSTPDRVHGEISHRWPKVLPDGKTLLFTIWTGPGADERAIVSQPLPAGERTVLVRGGDGGHWVEPGYLLYDRLDGLFAIPWRPGSAGLSGAVPITLSETARSEGEGGGAFDVSSGGTLVTLSGGAARLAQRLVWVDRSGTVEPLPLPDREYEAVALSPDERQAAVQIQDGVIGIWLYDFAGRTLTPFATSGGSSQAPVWSPDGKRIYFRGTRGGHRNVYWKSSDGTGDEVRLTSGEGVVETPMSTSPDGRTVVFTSGGGQTLTESEVWAVPADGSAPPRKLLEKGSLAPRVSPDGRWVAYQSVESGRNEICVRPYPGPGARKQVSTNGGQAPLWSRDGRELYFMTVDTLVAVDVKSGADIAFGTPHVLYEGRYRAALNANTAYDVSVDGRRFLRVRSVQPERGVTRIDVTQGFFGELSRLAAGK